MQNQKEIQAVRLRPRRIKLLGGRAKATQYEGLMALGKRISEFACILMPRTDNGLRADYSTTENWREDR
jgi:hypothetical protein